MKTVAVVHAKGSSERLPNKNLMELGGLPLIAHSIINARNSIADTVIIDSEDKEILEVGMAFGAKPLERPSYLARNEITGDDLAFWQAQSFPDYDIIVQVVPTSPFIKPETINKCINYALLDYNSSFTATSEHLYTWSQHVENGDLLPDYWDREGKIKNSNKLPYTFIEHTGVYAFKSKFAFIQHRRIDVVSFRSVPISPIEAIDINYEHDFEFAEVVWKGLNSSSP